jgi:enoyl-CoA hydratase
MTPTVRIEQAQGVALIVIDREEAGNSASAEVLAALCRFFEQAASSHVLRAVVLTGQGDRFFCAGGDVKRYRALTTREELDEAFSRARGLMDAIESVPVPVIAAINGWSLGGGSELMLACDIRIASPHARIGFPYNKLSLMPGWHGGHRLVRAVGESWARYLLLGGEPVDARRALAMGLVHEVAQGQGARARALELAATLAQRAPLSAGTTKRLLRSIHRESPEVSRRTADTLFQELWMSEDHREAEQAFAEKRPPSFVGR